MTGLENGRDGDAGTAGEMVDRMTARDGSGALPFMRAAVDADGVYTLLEGRIDEMFAAAGMPAVGHSVFDLDAEAPRYVAAVRRALAGEQLTELIERGGSTFEVHLSPLRARDGAILGAMVVTVDTTAAGLAEAVAVAGQRLESLSSLTLTNEALTDGAGLNGVLGRLAERAKILVQAEFAALSIFADGGRLERFIYTGMPDATAQKLGSPPIGRGLLGFLSQHDRPLRLTDLTEHPRFTGWPEGHPDMRAFLGIPIVVSGSTIGSFYMTRTLGAPPFDDSDEFTATLLGLQAAIAVASAMNFERTSRMSMLEERVVIAQDLHDGTIQSLYALGLEWESLARDTDSSAEKLREAISAGTSRISDVISDIRRYIQTLESAEIAASPELARDLGHVVRQLVPAGVEVLLNVTGPALNELTPRQATDLLFIAREALSNAVRHGAPTKIAIDVRQTAAETALTIQDNGAGYDQFNARAGLGTVTMRTRAERLGAYLTALSVPGMGTTIRVALPRDPEE